MEQQQADALELYRQCMKGITEHGQEQRQRKVGRSIYTAQVVLWLMMVQRLQPCGTLATGVGALLAGAADAPPERLRARTTEADFAAYWRL